MNPVPHQTQSLWMQSGTIADSGTLRNNIDSDVCVIGAGIAGLTTAYLLLLEGRTVVVLDDGPVGGGQTERTTAHLSNAIDDRYFKIAQLHGEEGSRLAASSHTLAIDRVEQIVLAEDIECDFERLDGFLFGSPDKASLLDRELKAVHKAGLVGVEFVAQSPLAKFETGPCLRFPGQAQFHPRKYHLLAMHTKQAAYITYVLAFAVPRGSVTKALYWDTDEPYHYVRLHSSRHKDTHAQELPNTESFDILIVGGEDHKTGQADDAEERYNRLETWARERFPIEGKRRYHWSGQVMETIDGLAFIGRNPLDESNVYIATGDSGQGMTHGTIAGILLTDLIIGRTNPWETLYAPSRKTLLAADKFLEENINVALQYGSWITGGDLANSDSIASGSGAVIRNGLSKVAAYRDENGILYEYSATDLNIEPLWLVCGRVVQEMKVAQMSKLETLSDAFYAELQDVYSAEQQLVKALPKMAKNSSSEKLVKAFEDHLEQTNKQVERVVKSFEETGKAAKAKKCEAMAGLVLEAEEMLDESADPLVKDAILIALAQKIEHYEIATYGTLCTWADCLGYKSAKKLLGQNLDEEEKADKLLTTLSKLTNEAANA